MSTPPEVSTSPESSAPEEIIDGVAGPLLGVVGGARTALEAELIVSHLMGTVRSGVEGDAEVALDVLLQQLVAALETIGTADALAVLRTLQVYGTDATMASAAGAAERLSAAGLADRPWAGRLGRPDVLRAWRYADLFGAQTSVGIQFTEQGRDHVLTVLVDHDLGGGVKDAWVAEGREARRMRDRVAGGLADEIDAEFADIGAAEAGRILTDALQQPPCPVQPDQVDDVAAHLQITRVRARRLRALA